MTLLSGLYYFYRNSALNRTNLKNAYRFLGIKTLLPTRANGTRWVGHVKRALDHFLLGYKAFRLHLEQLVESKEKGDSKAKAQGFLKLIKSQDIISFAHSLQDVLFVLQKVSLKFQQENSLVADMALIIKTTISQLHALSVKEGPHYQKFDNFEVTDCPTKGPSTHTLVQLSRGLADLKQHKLQQLDDICQALSTRFETNVDKVIRATSIANFKSWPKD